MGPRLTMPFLQPDHSNKSTEPHGQPAFSEPLQGHFSSEAREHSVLGGGKPQKHERKEATVTYPLGVQSQQACSQSSAITRPPSVSSQSLEETQRGADLEEKHFTSAKQLRGKLDYFIILHDQRRGGGGERRQRGGGGKGGGGWVCPWR